MISQKRIAVFLLCLTLWGCSSAFKERQDRHDEPQITQSAATPTKRNYLAETLNPLLENVETEEQANVLFEVFKTYALSRFDVYPLTTFSPTDNKKDNSSVKTVFSNVEYIQRLRKIDLSKQAAIELKVRQGSILESELLSTTELNDIIESASGVSVNSQKITAIKSYFYSLMPNLQTGLDPNLVTPLEAQLILWNYIIGDNGTAKPGSLKTKQQVTVNPEPLQENYASISGWNFKKWVSNVSFGVIGSPVVEKQVEVNIEIVENVANTTFKDLKEFIANPLCKIDNWHKEFLDLLDGPGTTNRTECLTSTPLSSGAPALTYFFTSSDLVNVLTELNAYAYFDNSNPPLQALAALPSKPSTVTQVNIASLRSQALAVTTEADLARLESVVSAIPRTSTQGRAFGQQWWDDNVHHFRKGDLFFFKRGGLSGQIISQFSSWTHTALAYDLSRDESIESLPENNEGVRLKRPPRDWAPAISFSVKRIDPFVMSPEQVAVAVERAKERYADKTPYFPSLSAPVLAGAITQQYAAAVAAYVFEWFSKNQSSSMYCSKFVWKVFNDAGLDLDSNRFTYRNPIGAPVIVDPLILSALASSIINQGRNLSATPDELYYSPHLMSDMTEIAFGLENINTAIDPSVSILSLQNPVKLMPYVLETSSIQYSKTLTHMSIKTYGEVKVTAQGALDLTVSTGVDLTPGFDVERGGQLDIHFR